MASVGAEFEDDISDWMESFRSLPEDRQENIKKWFATQKIIIDNSGLSVQEWFSHVQWAMDNPFDYRFVLDFPEVPEHDVGKDAAERSDATRDARDLVTGGESGAKSAPDGPGIPDKARAEGSLERELFSNFMKGRLGSK